MSRFTGFDRAREAPPGPAPVGSSPGSRTDDPRCDLYAPGHQIHYRHQGDAVHSPSLMVRDTLLHDSTVTLLLDAEQELVWRHHDPDRLRRVLELLRGKCVAYPRHHALRVGPYWFNCAAEADQWLDCRVTNARLPRGPAPMSAHR